MFASADGAWTVEHARLSGVASPSRITDPMAGDGEYLIVRYHGKTMAHATSPSEIAKFVDLSTLRSI